MSAISVVFLDIDGVLLPFNRTGDNLFPDETLMALSYILGEIKGARIVLSSTWRVQTQFQEQILAEFHRYGIANDSPLRSCKFLSITDPSLHSERQHEIADWLQKHRDEFDVAAWVALDDEELVSGESNKQYSSDFQDHVVKPDSHLGMTMEDAEMATNLLRNQIDRVCSRGT